MVVDHTKPRKISSSIPSRKKFVENVAYLHLPAHIVGLIVLTQSQAFAAVKLEGFFKK